MYEQPQWLARPADRPDVPLQILPLAGPRTVCEALFAILRFVPDYDPASRDVPGTGVPPNDLSLGGGKGSCRLPIAPGMIAGTALGPGRSGEVIPKTTESHWSGGQREP
jgi:hypothetical protein